MCCLCVSGGKKCTLLLIETTCWLLVDSKDMDVMCLFIHLRYTLGCSGTQSVMYVTFQHQKSWSRQPSLVWSDPDLCPMQHYPTDHFFWSIAIWSSLCVTQHCESSAERAANKASTSTSAGTQQTLHPGLFFLWALLIQSSQVMVSSTMIPYFDSSYSRSTSGLSDIGVMVSENQSCLPASTSSCHWVSVVRRPVDTLDYCWGCSWGRHMLPRGAEVLAAVDGWYDVPCLCLQHLVMSPALAAFFQGLLAAAQYVLQNSFTGALTVAPGVEAVWIGEYVIHSLDHKLNMLGFWSANIGPWEFEL